MAKGVMHVQWYATVFRGDMFADAVSETSAPLTLEYGATRYTVQRSQDDPYKILQMAWFNAKEDWYRYWEGPEMREFRARFSGKYQIPITYIWFDEYAAGGEVPETFGPDDMEPEPHPTPYAGA